MFKLDATNKAINIEVIIYFSGKLSSSKARQRPFMFTMPLNFSQKEQVTNVFVTFDKSKVLKHVKVEDFKQKLLTEERGSQLKMEEEKQAEELSDPSAV